MDYTFHVVIPDPSGARVLVVPGDTGWRLPRVSTQEPFGERFVVTDAQAGVRERLGLDIAVLRSVLVEQSDAFLFAENLTGRPPRLGEWYSEGSPPDRASADQRDRTVVQQWFTERREGKPRRLPLWANEGWFAEASSWIGATLPGVERVEQYITWSGSSILGVHVDGRRFYFKAAPDMFRQEAASTVLLAELFPEVVPRPVATEANRGWMLLEDFGDAFVGNMGLEQWEGALDTLLTVQRGSIPHVGSLLRAGFVDRRPAVLEMRIEDLALGRLGEVPQDSAHRLRSAVPRFKQLCAELEGSPIPTTLVHGDFHGKNVVVRDGRHMIFAWTDSCIAHPFGTLPRSSTCSALPRPTRLPGTD